MSEDTIFHKIIRKEIPADIVFESESLIAIRDTNPVAPVHILVIPKKTFPCLRKAQKGDAALLGHMLEVCAKIAKQENIEEEGYRVVINAGPNAGQAVDQLHFHIIGGRKMSWPPG